MVSKLDAIYAQVGALKLTIKNQEVTLWNQDSTLKEHSAQLTGHLTQLSSLMTSVKDLTKSLVMLHSEVQEGFQEFWNILYRRERGKEKEDLDVERSPSSSLVVSCEVEKQSINRWTVSMN